MAAVALEAVGGALSRLAVDLVAAVPAVVVVIAPPPVGDALRWKSKFIQVKFHKINQELINVKLLLETNLVIVALELRL